MFDFPSWKQARSDMYTVSDDLARAMAIVKPALLGFASTVRCDDPRGGAFCDRLIKAGAFGPPGSPPEVLANFLQQLSPGLASTAALIDGGHAGMRAADQA